jgi:hypothetical protein
MDIFEFIEKWFPKTKAWNNIADFILESGVKITSEINPKWLSGYTNIGISHKPHHIDPYIRQMEEGMFMLHDIVHNIFTLNVEPETLEAEYVNRQIYGELFTFYLTEFIIPQAIKTPENSEYFTSRGCYDLMKAVIFYKNSFRNQINIIDFMKDIFIKDNAPEYLKETLRLRGLTENFNKYSKMFKEDLTNSKKNFKILPKNISNYCMVGPTSQNHIDFFATVSNGTLKNIRRKFDLKLPEQWI